MSDITIALEPLTKSAFAPYGDVIETAGADHFPINAGTVERYHDLADIDVGVQSGGRVIVSIATCEAVSQLPYRIPVIERHPHGSQAFIPLSPVPMVIAVAEPGDNPDPTSLRGFLSNGNQGINYRPGTWHMPLISERQGQQYLVIDRAGPGNNCEELYLHDQVIVLHDK